MHALHKVIHLKLKLVFPPCPGAIKTFYSLITFGISQIRFV